MTCKVSSRTAFTVSLMAEIQFSMGFSSCWTEERMWWPKARWSLVTAVATEEPKSLFHNSWSRLHRSAITVGSPWDASHARPVKHPDHVLLSRPPMHPPTLPPPEIMLLINDITHVPASPQLYDMCRCTYSGILRLGDSLRALYLLQGKSEGLGSYFLYASLQET